MSDLNYFGSSDTVKRMWKVADKQAEKIRALAWKMGLQCGLRDEALEKYTDETVHAWRQAVCKELGIKYY